MFQFIDEISVWLATVSFFEIFLILFFPLTLDYLRIFAKIVFLELNRMKNGNVIAESHFKVHDKKISILIPAHNEESCVGESIEAALTTFYPNKEVIVIDDNSDDKTYKVAKQFAKKNTIKLVHLENGGSKAAALNFGYLYSTGEIIVTMDADTKLERHALERIVRKFDDNEIIAISGNIIPHGDEHVSNLLTGIQGYEYGISFEIGKRFSAQLNILLVISGAFAAFRRNALNWNGLFCTGIMAEDFEKSMQVQKIGKKVAFAEKSYAHSFCPNNWKAWLTQRTRWSHGYLQTLLKNKDVLFSSRYRLGFRLKVLDMWFTDVILSFLYFIGFAMLALFVIIVSTDTGGSINENIPNFGYLLGLIFSIYFVSEFVIFSHSRNVASRSIPTKMMYLIPVMIFLYRPLLKIIILRGYVKAIFGKKINW